MWSISGQGQSNTCTSPHSADSAYLQVSSFNWDHNDNFPQFSGCHALLPGGYMSVLSRLAEGFEIQLDSVVKHVELLKREGGGYSGVRVTDTRGNEFSADRVSHVIPLSHTVQVLLILNR